MLIDYSIELDYSVRPNVRVLPFGILTSRHPFCSLLAPVVNTIITSLDELCSLIY